MSDGELKKRIDFYALNYRGSSGKTVAHDDVLYIRTIKEQVDETKKDFLKVFERYINNEFPEYEQYLIAIEECFKKWFGNIPKYSGK